MRLLALDQSITSCGWVVTDGQQAQSGAWHLADNIPGRAGGFSMLRRHLTRLHKAEPLTLIAYETPIKTPVDKVEKLIALYGLVAVLEGWAYTNRVPVISIAQQDWRATWLGKTRKDDDKKRLAVLRARDFGFDPTTHDEAEAIGIADHVLHLQKITPAWRTAQPFLLTLT